MNDTPNQSIQDIIAAHSPPISELTQRLPVIVRESVPAVKEKAYPGWHGIGYTHPRAGYIGAIFPRDDSVSLGFEWGVLLSDPDGLLTGSGSQLRYVECAPDAPLPVEAIRALLLACLELPNRRSEKLALVQAGARPAA